MVYKSEWSITVSSNIQACSPLSMQLLGNLTSLVATASLMNILDYSQTRIFDLRGGGCGNFNTIQTWSYTKSQIPDHEQVCLYCAIPQASIFCIYSGHWSVDLPNIRFLAQNAVATGLILP